MPYIPLNRGAGRLFEDNLNRMLEELFLMLNTVDSTNSSTVELGAAGVFTGEWLDVSGYNSTMIAVATDADGSYAVQYSPDAVNVDSSLTRYYRVGEINPPHRFTNTRQYMRIVFTNGADAQTYFRLQAMIGDFTELNAPVDGTLSNDFDATVVRPTDFHDEVALNLRQGLAANLKFGFNDDIDSGASEVVASFGGTFTPLTTASTLTIVSTSTADTAAGTGARTLFISGIGSDRLSQSDFVTLNGTTNVVTTSTWLGINRIVVLSSGTGQKNAGDINVTATTGGSNQAQIPAGKSVTQQAIYFNQAGHSALIKSINVSVLKLSGGSSPRVTFRLKVFNPNVTNSVYEIRRFRLDAGVDNKSLRDFPVGLRVDPTDVVWMECETDTNNTIVETEMDIIEYKNAAT